MKEKVGISLLYLALGISLVSACYFSNRIDPVLSLGVGLFSLILWISVSHEIDNKE